MSAASDVGHLDLDPGEKAFYAVAVVLLVLGAGLMSGLTLGLLSLDVLDLEVGAAIVIVPAGVCGSAAAKPVWQQQQHLPQTLHVAHVATCSLQNTPGCPMTLYSGAPNAVFEP